ncbi:unnamed protein product [Schistosoma mattheei]|uniref:Uncharacterized protein n=1 Tax=Schistosoma mattheei TaxID=31246 RepID=A0A183NXG1_9TREM|nr:unnamed protein product [Schistosoma mattheei]
MELKATVNQHQGQNFQYKCQNCSTVWSGNLENYESHHPEDTVDRTHFEESTQLHHKTSLHMESSRPKKERKTKEHIMPRNGDRHEKNEQKSDRTRKEGRVGQIGLENAGRRPMLHWE